MIPDGLFAKYVHIVVVVISYWCISIFTVFVNKTLLSSDIVNLDAPLFVTWFQCVVSSTICFTLSSLAQIFPATIKFPKGSPLSAEVVRKVLPVSVLFTGMIAFNNLCLKHVDVAFYFVGRSLTTVFNVLLTYFILGQKTSFPAISCCALILSGFWLGVDQENILGSLSVLGTVYGVLGSLALSLYSIYTKRVLPFLNNEVWLLSYFNNVYSCVLFIPMIILNGEVPVIMKYDQLFSIIFWALMIVGGLCGFSIGFVTALQIKVTSPLTHNISGTAKACAQTVLATYWYDVLKPPLWWFSNWIILLASAAYARIKQLEMQKQHHIEKQHQQHKTLL